jgi:hypothetical protein
VLPDLKRILLLLLLLALPFPGALACSRGPDAESRRQAATLGEALQPGFFAAALGRVGGAHYHGTSRFAAGLDTPGDGVTTTTDVWVDRSRNYRVLEVNDRDGGREVILTGRELAVALRYGKMIRRLAEEPEPTKLLEEALGAPFAAWEVVRPWTAVQPAGAQLVGGSRATEYRIARAAARTEDPSAQPAPTGLRAWRATVSVGEVGGRVLVDDASGALMQVELTARFTTKRDGRPLQGTLDVRGALSEVASTAPVQRPVAEDLALRQRIVPEQRDLLSGLPSTRGVATPPPPARPRTQPR